MLRDVDVVSRVANACDGISGVQLCCGDVIIQVMEGGRDPVEKTYSRIARDPRHAYPRLLIEEAIAARAFQGWSLWARNISYASEARMDYLERARPFNPRLYSAPDLLRILQVLATLTPAAASATAPPESDADDTVFL